MHLLTFSLFKHTIIKQNENTFFKRSLAKVLKGYYSTVYVFNNETLIFVAHGLNIYRGMFNNVDVSACLIYYKHLLYVLYGTQEISKVRLTSMGYRFPLMVCSDPL